MLCMFEYNNHRKWTDKLISNHILTTPLPSTFLLSYASQIQIHSWVKKTVANLSPSGRTIRKPVLGEKMLIFTHTLKTHCGVITSTLSWQEDQTSKAAQNLKQKQANPLYFGGLDTLSDCSTKFSTQSVSTAKSVNVKMT